MFQTIKKAIKHSAVYGIGSISSKLIGFILLPLYTAHILPSEYGVLSIVEITTTLLVAIVGLKINAAFFRWYWDKDFIDKQKSLFFTSIVFIFISCVLLVFPLFFFVDSISLLLFDSVKYTYLIKLMLISTALQVAIQMVLYLMQLQEKSVFYSVTNIIKLVLSLILTIIFIIVFDRSINGIYEALIISQIVFLLMTIRFVYQNIEFRFEKGIIPEMLSFSLPLIFAEISGILLTSTDRYILNFMTTQVDVGIYSLGYKISNTIRVLIYSSVMTAIAPMIYQYIDKPNNKRFYSKILTYFSFGTMFIVLFLSIFGKEIIELIALNEEYWTASPLVPILSFAILFGILKDASLTGLNITKKTGIIAIIVMIMSLLNILLNILFIPYWKAEGAAIATLIVRIVSFIVSYNIAQKYYKIPYEVNKIILVLSIGVILIIISLMLDEFSIWTRISIKSIFILIFPILLYMFKFFEEVEIQRLKQGIMDVKNLIFRN